MLLAEKRSPNFQSMLRLRQRLGIFARAQKFQNFLIQFSGVVELAALRGSSFSKIARLSSASRASIARQ